MEMNSSQNSKTVFKTRINSVLSLYLSLIIIYQYIHSKPKMRKNELVLDSLTANFQRIRSRYWKMKIKRKILSRNLVIGCIDI